MTHHTIAWLSSGSLLLLLRVVLLLDIWATSTAASSCHQQVQRHLGTILHQLLLMIRLLWLLLFRTFMMTKHRRHDEILHFRTQKKKWNWNTRLNDWVRMEWDECARGMTIYDDPLGSTDFQLLNGKHLPDCLPLCLTLGLSLAVSPLRRHSPM